MTSYDSIYSYFSITHCVVVCMILHSLDRFLFLYSYHVINHLTPMCQPHGFVVTDHDCSQPIACFFGFHVCPLLETKHGLCTGPCAESF
jgi:hypothetical protein